jgi:acyl-coenzyme A thioesterase PaaI-like protein
MSPALRSGWGAGDGDDSAPGGPEFASMIGALRLLQDRITGAAPPPELLKEMTRTFEQLAADLAPHTVPEREQITGHRIDLPGRAQTLVPVFEVEEADDKYVRGRVRFGRHYLGGNGAVHGGAIPLLFDEILGRHANAGGPSREPPTCTSITAVSPRSARTCARRPGSTARKAASASSKAPSTTATSSAPRRRASSSNSAPASPEAPGVDPHSVQPRDLQRQVAEPAGAGSSRASAPSLRPGARPWAAALTRCPVSLITSLSIR